LESADLFRPQKVIVFEMGKQYKVYAESEDTLKSRCTGAVWPKACKAYTKRKAEDLIAKNGLISGRNNKILNPQFQKKYRQEFF